MGKDAKLIVPIKKKADSSATLTVETTKTVTLRMRSVLWKDAGFNINKFSQDEIEQLKPIEVYSSGYLVRQDDEVVVLAQNYFGVKNKFEHFMIIPSSLIIAIEPTYAKDGD